MTAHRRLVVRFVAFICALAAVSMLICMTGCTTAERCREACAWDIAAAYQEIGTDCAERALDLGCGFCIESERLQPGHGEPIGAVFLNGIFYCRDANENLWKSRGECD